MNRIVASAQISLMDYNDAIVTGNMPANPEKDMLWLNTSVNPHIMKQYTGSEWIIVGELDPEYTEKLEVITGNITNLELTLGNMADDGKLDYGDRQEIVDKLLPVIGYLPVNTSVALKTVNQLDTDKKGSFYQLRQAAQNAGIVTSNTAYTGLASAWNALRTYLGGLNPKPWDLSTVNQDAVAQVDKGTFRTHWLNYYNAEYTLATATTQILHSAISTINTTTLPAMRDSALSSAEKTAIKQSLVILSSEKTAMDGEITGLKANPKFENQTPLNEAKSAYDTSYTGITTAINAVLAVPTGTLIPSNLILEVENAVSSYSAKLSLLKKAMQDSQTAIAEKVSDDASKELSDSLKGYVDKITYGQDIATIQSQVDGAITTWFGDSEPTLLKAPAKDWSTNLIKDTHLGDLYYDNKSGYAYRFGKDGTGYSWIRIVDADVVAALAAAQNAQDTADGKRRAFYNQPKPPYDVGDLWVQGEKGELKRAVVTRDKNGLYHENDWVKAVKYTDDTAIENLEIGGRNLLLNTNSLENKQPHVTGFGLAYNAITVSQNNKILKLTTAINNAEKHYRFIAPVQNNIKDTVIVPGKTYTISGIYKSSIAFFVRGQASTNGASWHINYKGDVLTESTSWTPFAYTFKLDENAVSFYISIQSVSRSSEGYIELKDLMFEKGSKATDWTPAPEDVEKSIGDSLTAAENYANNIKTGLETQIDGKVETYNQTADPATSWTAEEKIKHKGDLWYHPTNKITKLWSGSSWTTLEDAVATGAQQLAQAKNRVFTSTPTTPYEIGDLWVQGTSGDLMRCVTARASGSFNINDWGKAVKYTDDTKANAAATAASNAQIAANKAQEDATKANGAVSDIISDSKMTPDEKVILQREWLNIQYERNEILSQAERYVIDNASYRSVYDTLSGYLAPFFTNLTTTQNVNGETLRSNFQRYYEQRQAILDAISVAAQQKVLDLQTQVDAGPFADKTSVLSGTKIFTDKADKDAVVHMEVDGKSYQHAGSGKNLVSGELLNPITIFGSGVENEVTHLAKLDFSPLMGKKITISFDYKSSLADGLGGFLLQTDFPWYHAISNRIRPSTTDWVNEVYTTNIRQAEDFPAGFRIRLDNFAGTLILKNFKIEEGAVSTPYEPPAPSPDYPIEIHSLNDFDVVSSVGRENLLPENPSVSGEGRDVYTIRTPVLKELTYTVSFDAKSNSGKDIAISNFFYSPNTTISSLTSTGNVGSRADGHAPMNITTEVKRYWITWKQSKSGDGKHIILGRVPTGSNVTISNVKLQEGALELGSEVPMYTKRPSDILYDTYTPTLYKTNILLSEPLRSVGDAKDRLFRDSDGLWKVERNLAMYISDGTENWSSSIYYDNRWDMDGSPLLVPHSTESPYITASSHFVGSEVANSGYGTTWTRGGSVRVIFEKGKTMTASSVKSYMKTQYDSGTPVTWVYKMNTPTIETLDQELQDKLNNLRSYKDSNYLYTIVDKTNILPSYVRGNLKPNLKATFKSQTWYQNYKRGNDLRHFVEVKGLDRAIRFGMLVDYQSFAMPTANWLYFCKIQTNTDDFREELVDEDGSIFDYTTQREIKVPKQALDLRGVAEGTTGYLAFDTRNQLMWFIHYKRNYTYTTNPKTGITEKIPSSEHWIKWNPGKTGHNTQLVLDESVYIVGEIER